MVYRSTFDPTTPNGYNYIELEKAAKEAAEDRKDETKKARKDMADLHPDKILADKLQKVNKQDVALRDTKIMSEQTGK